MDKRTFIYSAQSYQVLREISISERLGSAIKRQQIDFVASVLPNGRNLTREAINALRT